MVKEYRDVSVEFPPTDAAAEKAPVVKEYYPTGVYVSGAASSVEKIKEVVGTIKPEKATGKSEWITVKLSPVNKKGKEIVGITLSQETVEANIQKLPVKAVDLNISESDKKLDAESVGIPERIRIAGLSDAIEGIDEIKAIISSDEKGNVIVDAELPTDVYLVIGEDNGKIIWN